MNSEITIKLGRETETVRDASLAKEIREACKLDTEAKAVAVKLGELKKSILESARKRIPKDTDTITFLNEGTECKVIFGKTKFIDPKDVPALKKELRSTFEVLIEHSSTWKPTKKFLEFAEDKKEIQLLISEKNRSPRVSFSIVKD